MNTNLLYVPLRLSRPLNLNDELRHVINKDFFQPPSSFEDDLLYVGNLRDRISNIKNETNTKEDESILLQYYAILEMIRSKFPETCIEFGWFGTLTYGPSGPYKSRSLKFEELNIMFQLGSLYSQFALKELRHTDNGLKQACMYFQLSAGVFQLMTDLLERETKDHISPQDLEKETLNCLIQLMLAQAQETIWQKAVANPGAKDSVISRLAVQTSEYYSRAFKCGNSSEFIKLEWINHIAVKMFHFKAAGHFRTAKIAQDNFQYGEQVAHLRISSKNIKNAFKYKKYVSSFVLEDLQGLSDIVSATLKTAEKDNDLVYLKVVPGENDLKPIAGVDMVKPICPDGLTSPISERQVFKDLIPYMIIHVAQALRERQDDFIRERVQAPLQSLNNLMNSFLIERGLPASIDTIQQPENIPDSIIEHSKEILNMGGQEFIEGALREIGQLAQDAAHLVDECERRISLDSQEDDMLRDRLSGNAEWTRPNTTEAAEELISKIAAMREYLSQAKSGDERVLSEFLGIKPYLETYSGGPKAIESYIPNSTYVKLDGRLLAIISDLRGALAEVADLENDRKIFSQGLEIKARDNNILPKLIDDYKQRRNEFYDNQGNFKELAFEPIYENHMRIYDNDLQYVESLKNRQIKLESQLDTLNKRFLEEYEISNNISQSNRRDALQALESVHSKYLQIISNLNEGSRFYNEFITKGNSVLRACEDYLYQRRLESRDLEHALNRNNEMPTDSYVDSDDNIGPRNDVVSPQGKKSGIWNPTTGLRFG